MKRMWMMVAVLLSVGVCGFAQLEKKGSATKPAETPSLRMVSIFGDHMVLQAGKEIPLWGWASPGAEVRATSISGDSFGPVKADKNGRWSLKIGESSGPPLIAPALSERSRLWSRRAWLSILITSAPSIPSSRVPWGPAQAQVKSVTRIPDSGP